MGNLPEIKSILSYLILYDLLIEEVDSKLHHWINISDVMQATAGKQQMADIYLQLLITKF